MLQNKKSFYRLGCRVLLCFAVQTAHTLNDKASFTVRKCHYLTVKEALLYDDSDSIGV